jgi:hypothetical protein
MEQKDIGRTRKRQEITVRQILRDRELWRTLDRYENFIRWNSGKYARVYEDRKDLQQVGREAVVRVFKRINESELEVEREKGYYLNSVDHAMLDYARMLYRKTYIVWQYDRKSGPTRTKRYRYGREWKTRIQYHGDALKVLIEQRKNLQSYEEISEQ